MTLHDGVPVPKVIDFGIAKATQGELTDKTVFTQFQQFIGTPAYISPEQAEMSSLDIDTRADIYSLGVLLYELLVGQTPFDAKEMMQGGLDALVRIIREREPVRPSTKLSQTLVAADVRRLKSPSPDRPATDEEIRSSSRRLLRIMETITLLRGDLDWIVMKCLEKDRTRRYDTANGLAADITRHLTNEPVLARPPSVAYKFQKAYRRNKLAFGAGAAVVAALVAGLTLAAVGWRQTRVERDKALTAQREAEAARQGEQQRRLEAMSAQQVAETQRERAEQEAASRRVQLYAAEVNLAGETLAEDDFDRARELLARQVPAPGETNDLRGFEWRYLWQQSQSAELTTLGQHDAPVHGVRFSPDGTFLASSEINGTVKLWDNRTRKLIATLRDTTIQPIDGNGWEMLKPLAFSPDSSRLAVGAGRDIILWKVASHERIAVLKGHSN